MMDWLKKLDNLKKQQQNMVAEIESVVREIENDNTLQQQAHWRQLAEESNRELEQLRQELVRVTTEKDRLQTALRDQLLQEKFNLVKTSRDKLTTYFQRAADQYQDRLTEAETAAKQRMSQLKNELVHRLAYDQAIFDKQIAQLESDLTVKLQQQRTELKQTTDKIVDDTEQQLNSLDDAELTPEMVQQRIKQNQWEMKLGLNLLNKLGVLLIFLGMCAAFKYSYDNWMSNYLKGICFFLLGILFLAGGEWFYRKKKEGLATGLVGGGLAILYGSVFFCYFPPLKIIPMETAIFLAVLITGTALTFSLRYNSQTIGCFALVGGYLPFISYVAAFGLTENIILAVMGYLLLLNLLLLSISYWKNWSLIKYISFIFNTPALIYLVANLSRIDIAIIYAGIIFLMYLGITLIYPVARQKALGNGDTILLGLNTLVNCLIIFMLFNKAGWNDYRGILALGFAVVYTGLGRLTRMKIAGGAKTAILFYGTALMFALLTVPFQFGVKWLILGWLVEAVVLIILSSKYHQTIIEWIGWIVFLFCGFLFCLSEMVRYVAGEPDALFQFKYLALTGAEVVVLLHYLLLQKKGMFLHDSSAGNMVSLYKYFVIACVWIYLVITGNDYIKQFLPSLENYYFYLGIWVALVSLGLSTLIQRWPLLYGNSIRLVAAFLSIAAVVICFGLNVSHVDRSSDSFTGRYLALTLLIAINGIVFFNLRYLLKDWVEHRELYFEHYPLILGLFLLINSTSFIITQFHLTFSNLIFSMVYLLLAIGFIIYGFVRKYLVIRRTGLTIIIFAVAKLFLYDLSYLGSLGKIIAYFSFGITLLAISFLYQKISDSLGDKKVGKA